MKNESGLRPKGRSVLVKVVELKSDGGIVIPDFVRANTAMIETKARVVEVGPSAWPDEPPRAVPGELVLIAKMAGVSAIGPKDKEMYRFINDRDIFAGLEEEDHE